MCRFYAYKICVKKTGDVCSPSNQQRSNQHVERENTCVTQTIASRELLLQFVVVVAVTAVTVVPAVVGAMTQKKIYNPTFLSKHLD